MPRSAYVNTVLAVAALTACGKGNNSSSSEPIAPRGRIAGLAVTALDYFPKDVAFVGGVNWVKLRENKLVKDALEHKLSAERKQMFDELKQTCGLDLLGDVEQLAMAGRDAD